MKALTLLSALIVTSTLTSASAQTIAQWTFETSIPTTAGPHAAEVGTGSALGFHAGTTAYSNPAGNGSAESFSSTGWAVGDYYQFSLSTLGYSGIGLSFDHTSSGTGPRDFGVEYSTDGSVFTSIGAYSVIPNAAPNPVWNSTTASSLYTYNFDLSAINAVDNESTIYFRLVNVSTMSAAGGTVASGGSSRIDNFTVSVVPEPSSLALVGGLMLLVGRNMMRRH